MAYSRFSPGKYSLWLDWETSGAAFGLPYPDQFVPGMYQGIQLGLVVADNENFEEQDALKINIKFDPTQYKWQEEAQKVHGLTQEWLEENGVDAEEAVVQIIEFITKWFGADVICYDGQGEDRTRTICFGGHNLGFDIAALQALLKRFKFSVTEHHVRLDTSAIGFLAVGIYKSGKLFEHFGAEKRGDHDALDDTRQSLAVATGVKALIKSALEG
jgi:oligoribonuclease (3'-5' exoribonuclease)